MPLYIVYNDDTGDKHERCFGIEKVENMTAAEKFIEERLSHSSDQDINNYKVIQGNMVTVQAVHRISKVKVGL